MICGDEGSASRGVLSLDEDACWDLLPRARVGRLAWTGPDGRILVVPVNFGLDGRDVVGCIHSAVHVVQVSGYRWCRSCRSHAMVAADELAGDIRVTCSRCGRTPAVRASRQIIRTCTASIAAAQDH